MTDPRRDLVGSILTRIRETVTAVTVYLERTASPAPAKAAASDWSLVPVGAFVIRGDQVTWKPAIPPGLIVIGLLIGGRLLRKAIRTLS